MLERKLTFTHVGKARFVDQRIADGPGVAGIVLLVSRSNLCAEAWHVRAGSLEIVKRLKLVVVGEIVIEAEILMIVDVMVESKSELIRIVETGGNRLVGDAIWTVGCWHETQHVDCDWIHTLRGDDRIAARVRRKDLIPENSRGRRRPTLAVNRGRAARSPVQR